MERKRLPRVLAALGFLSLCAAPGVRAQSERDFFAPLQNAQSRAAAWEALRAPAADGWNYGTAPGRRSPFFWDFKYFNFHGRDVSGNLTFFTAAPWFSRRMTAIAHLYCATEIKTYRKVFDLGCVRGSEGDAGLKLCSEGGIEVLAPDRYRVTLNIGAVRWDVEFRGQVLDEEAPYSVALDGLLAGEMSWKPVFARAGVNGTIEDGGEVIELENAPAYHDQNWGRWNPSRQPYYWLHYSGKDEEGRPVDVLLGDFYRNQNGRSGKLILGTASGTREYAGGEFEVTLLKWGRAETERFGLADDGEYVSSRPIDPAFARGDHAVPVEFEIRAKDGSLALHAAALLDDAAGPKLPAFLRPLADFTIDEQLIRVELRAEPLPGQTFRSQGLGEFQTITKGAP